jgi:outer membrane receptor protein involved in Fe transport
MQNYAGAFTFTSLASYRQTLIGIRQGLTTTEIRASGGGASQFSLTAGNPLASLNQFDYGLFVQDDWRVRPNLTLSGGLRYEAQTNASDWADIQPRFGFA